ncbi:MAG: class I SAM-dependent methyltransferase [Candidatus Omnitrophica bacterium]|nr:class I SAM-dependent methyltransferase [Candidatus Omnitrophota bacterium]
MIYLYRLRELYKYVLAGLAILWVGNVIRYYTSKEYQREKKSTNGDERRLNRFFGEVASSQNKCIIDLISGRRILEIGCGYGHLISQIMRELPYAEVSGIDTDSEALDISKKLYGINVKQMSAYKMDFPDGCFETVIMRDAVHHFSDDNLGTVLREIRRVCSKELIVFDPNVNWIVKFSRKLIGYEDPEAPSNHIVKALESNGFEVISLGWRDVIALPLSGGFFAMELVPNVKFFKDTVMTLDKVLNIVLSKLNIQRYFCWRYIIYAIRKDI